LGQKIKEAKTGQVTFRVDSGSNLHALIGKVDFTDEQLLVNLRELMKALSERRPATLKGKYLVGAFMKSTMGPRWRINLNEIDPKGSKNIWGLLDLRRRRGRRRVHDGN
jgi:large subunit ribosomal protein L1